MRKKLSRETDAYAVRFGVSFAIENVEKLDALAAIAGINRSRFLEKIVTSLPEPSEAVPSAIEVLAPANVTAEVPPVQTPETNGDTT